MVDLFFHWFSFSLFLYLFCSFQAFANNFFFLFSQKQYFCFLLVVRRRGRRIKKNKEKKYRKKSTETLSSRLDWKHEVEHGTAVCRKPNIWYQINEKCFAARFQKRYSKVWPTTRLSTVQVELSQRKWKSFFLLLSN